MDNKNKNKPRRIKTPPQAFGLGRVITQTCGKMSSVGEHYENFLCAFNFPIVCTFNPETQAYIPVVDLSVI